MASTPVPPANPSRPSADVQETNAAAPIDKLRNMNKPSDAQKQKLFVLWLLLSGNASSAEKTLEVWDEKIASHVTDLPNIKSSFENAVVKDRGALNDATEVFQNMYNHSYDGPGGWNGLGDCFFTHEDVIKLFPEE